MKTVLLLFLTYHVKNFILAEVGETIHDANILIGSFPKPVKSPLQKSIIINARKYGSPRTEAPTKKTNKVKVYTVFSKLDENHRQKYNVPESPYFSRELSAGLKKPKKLLPDFFWSSVNRRKRSAATLNKAAKNTNSKPAAKEPARFAKVTKKPKVPTRSVKLTVAKKKGALATAPTDVPESGEIATGNKAAPKKNSKVKVLQHKKTKAVSKNAKAALKKDPDNNAANNKKTLPRGDKSRRHRKHKVKKPKKGGKNHKQKKKHGKHSRRVNEGVKEDNTTSKDSRRLIAARDAVIEDYPYMASIQKNGEHWCSGALLNPRIVITTANCVWKSDRVSRLHVRVGSRYAGRGGQEADIQEVMKHPKWSIRKNPDYDVALLYLDRFIQFSHSVHGVDIPNRVMLPPFDDAWVTSWGADRRDGIFENRDMTLQVYHARLMDREKCNNVTLRYGVLVSENFICLTQTGRRAPCTRDTGAPAVSDGVLWGMASWGIRKLCGTERFPAMFSYLASDSNMDFIMNATHEMMSEPRPYPYADRYAFTRNTSPSTTTEFDPLSWH